MIQVYYGDLADSNSLVNIIRKVKSKLGLSLDEYDYMIANEHVNSIFNLISIIKYKYKKNILKESYLPFHIKLLDLNLFYNLTLKK